MSKSRIIVWFSCGACSTVALYEAIKKYGKQNVFPVYCDVGGNGIDEGEHIDNKRFLADVQNAFDIKINILQSDKYESPNDVYEKTGYLVGRSGARCTVELKKVLRFRFQLPDDIQIFGYASNEKKRQERFIKSFPEVITDFILNDKDLTKSRCKGLLKKWGLLLPYMYRLGYNNNNCIGCPKGGKGYWNKIRIDFPVKFWRMARLERKLNISCIREAIGKDASGKIIYRKVFLDELDPKAGNHKTESFSCDFVCQSMDTL